MISRRNIFRIGSAFGMQAILSSAAEDIFRIELKDTELFLTKLGVNLSGQYKPSLDVALQEYYLSYSRHHSESPLPESLATSRENIKKTYSGNSKIASFVANIIGQALDKVENIAKNPAASALTDKVSKDAENKGLLVLLSEYLKETEITKAAKGR